MSRFAASLIALALVASPAVSLAAPKAATVKFSAATLNAPGGQQVIAQKIAQTAETWCRARPAGKTIADCRKTLTSELTAAVDEKVEMAAKTRQHRLAAK